MTTDRTTARSVQNLLHWTYETPRSTHLRFLLAPVCLIVLAVLAEGKAAAQTFETVEVRSLTLTNEQFLAGDTKGGEPVTLSGNLHLPAGDNWTLAGPCRAYINRLAEAGYDAVMTEYPGVGHAFDGRVGACPEGHRFRQR